VLSRFDCVYSDYCTSLKGAQGVLWQVAMSLRARCSYGGWDGVEYGFGILQTSTRRPLGLRLLVALNKILAGWLLLFPCTH
jgi:hypothetical protein